MDALEALKVVSVDQHSGKATLLLERTAFHARRDEISAAIHKLPGPLPENAQAMLRYLDAVYEGHGQVKRNADRVRTTLTPRPSHFEQFKVLWAALNRDVVMRFELDAPALVSNIVAAIATDFDVRPLTLTVERATHVQDVSRVESTGTSYEARSHTVYTLAEFITELANATTLSRSTLTQVLATKFAQSGTTKAARSVAYGTSSCAACSTCWSTR